MFNIAFFITDIQYTNIIYLQIPETDINQYQYVWLWKLKRYGWFVLWCPAECKMLNLTTSNHWNHSAETFKSLG